MKISNRRMLSLGIFVAIFLIDFITKKCAISWNPAKAFGDILQLGFVSNSNDIASNTPHGTMRVIHYASFLGPLLLMYFFLLSQMRKKISYGYFQPWISIWVAGLVGNLFDRMFYGQVIGWIKVSNWDCMWSVASIAIVIGLAGCLFQMIRHRKKIFGRYWKRKMKMTHPRFQTSYIIKMLSVSGFLAVSLLVFSYTFLKYYVFQFGIVIPTPMLRVFVIEFGLIIAIFMGILLLMGMYFSAKIAGPIYAFEMYIEKLKNGEDAQFKLREDDELKELESIAKDIKDHWKS